MAGHSQFKNIMYRKGAQDAKKAKIFAKITREIISSVKVAGPDPNANARLRLAIQNAKTQNMPKDNIERAIKKADTTQDQNYQQTKYEAYGPGGVAFIVETLSDNKNRTVGAIRAAFAKYGGNLAENGAVEFMFEHVGEIIYDQDKQISDEDIFNAAIEAGAEDVITEESGLNIIICPFNQLAEITQKLTQKIKTPRAAKPIWKPKNTIPVNKENAETLIKLIATLEDHDDVQDVYTNFDIPDDIMNQITQI